MIFQALQGPAHNIESFSECLHSIRREIEGVEEAPEQPMFVNITYNIPVLRVNLKRCKAEGILGREIGSCFYEGKKIFANAKRIDLIVLLQAAKEILQKDPFFFEPSSVHYFFQKIQRDNFPAISHSLVYREMYKPHYRVIPALVWNKFIYKFFGSVEKGFHLSEEKS